MLEATEEIDIIKDNLYTSEIMRRVEQDRIDRVNREIDEINAIMNMENVLNEECT